MSPLILWAAEWFGEKEYMRVTKIEGVLWTVADLVLVFYLLRLADHVRKKDGQTKATVRWTVFFITLLASPFLLLTSEPASFFRLEIVICTTHFLVILYSIVMEGRRLAHYLPYIFSEYAIGNRAHGLQSKDGRDKSRVDCP